MMLIRRRLYGSEERETNAFVVGERETNAFVVRVLFGANVRGNKVL